VGARVITALRIQGDWEADASAAPATPSAAKSDESSATSASTSSVRQGYDVRAIDSVRAALIPKARDRVRVRVRALMHAADRKNGQTSAQNGIASIQWRSVLTPTCAQSWSSSFAAPPAPASDDGADDEQLATDPAVRARVCACAWANVT
jgi:hypothetical protein